MYPSAPTTRIRFADETRLPLQGPTRSEAAPEPAITDYARVNELLGRCWRELDGVDLNVKLTDMIRLLEFKHKLGTAARAEQEFWRLIDTIRRDELTRFGDPDTPETE